MDEYDLPNAGKRVDAKTEELMAEFFAYRDASIAEDPNDPLDPRMIFESWAIQKIAGLQVVVMDLVRELNQINRTSQISNGAPAFPLYGARVAVKVVRFAPPPMTAPACAGGTASMIRAA